MADGGIGETALMGAALGGGAAAISGKDPLKGALLGGLGGYVFDPSAGMVQQGGAAAASSQAAAPAFDLGEFTGVDKAIADQALQNQMSADAMAQFYGSDMASQMPSQIATQPTGIEALPAAQQSVVAGQMPATPTAAGSVVTPPGIPTPPPTSSRPNSKEFLQNPLAWMQANPMKTAGAALGLYGLANMNNLMKPNYMKPYQPPTAEQYGLGAKLSPNYKATVPMQAGGQVNAVEQMSNANAVGQNTGYPQADITHGAYATPWQTPVSRNMLEGAADTGVNPITGEMSFGDGGGISGLMHYARGGNVSTLGSYSDGGRMLKGPGDGMSDSIPGVIANKQPARLADGEFVVPADVVSHLGNGSTDAGAKQLYSMMDKVRQARTGRKSQGKQINPRKYMPA